MTTHPQRALRIAGCSNIAIAAAQAVGLIWAWRFFSAVGVDDEMRELAAQGAALPYILTLVTCSAFLVFGLYALSGAGDLRRVPFLRTGLVTIAGIYLCRATVYEGIDAVRDGDVTQIAFAVVALSVGLCYAYGAIALHRAQGDAPAPRLRAASQTSPAGR